MSKLRLAIFDLDGTLIEFHHTYLFEQAQMILPRLGFEDVKRELLKHLFSEFDFFGFSPATRRAEVEKGFWELFDIKNFPPPVLIDGVLEVLEDLASVGLHTAIATARAESEEMLMGRLKGTGLLKYIDVVCTRQSDEIHWTDKTGTIKTCLNRCGCSPNQAFMVGDIPPDIQSAKATGLALAIAVESGGIGAHVLRKAEPDFLLSSLKGLRLDEIGL